MDSVDEVHKKFGGLWEGESKIVMAIDIGTTQSGVAVSFLQEHSEQKIMDVANWPGQENQAAHAKIPTLVLYDADKKPVSFGAEALQMEDEAEEQGWQFAKHFKLHLHPSKLSNKHHLDIDPLPSGIPLGTIYVDFLGYLLKNTQRHFEERVLDGETIWSDYYPTMDVVIAHPNGWGIREQAFLRTAAVKAGLTTEEQASEKVHFVNEAEASVHFCVHFTTLANSLKYGVNFAVCDAGGSTVDTTVYTITEIEPLLELEELCAPACVQAGAIFVDKQAGAHLNRVFREANISSEDAEDYLKLGAKEFEQHAKRRFRNTSVQQLIKIGPMKLNNDKIHTSHGKMSLTGTTMKSLFDPCVDQIVSSVRSQLDAAAAPVSYIILVGGFGESHYLREQLKSRVSTPGTQVVTTNDQPSSKAVATGALIWRCLSTVISRVAQYSLGVESMTPLVHNHKEHSGRQVVTWPSATFIKGVWSQIVTKGLSINQDTVTRRAYYREYSTSGPSMPTMKEEIYCHHLGGTPPWLRTKSGALVPGFERVCVVTAELNDLRNALQLNVRADGTRYWTLRFSICVYFGRTEWKAYVEWLENNKPKKGKIEIIPASKLI